jgi:hypothetical protein
MIIKNPVTPSGIAPAQCLNNHATACCTSVCTTCKFCKTKFRREDKFKPTAGKDHIVCIHLTLRRKSENSNRQCTKYLTDFIKTYDSFTRMVLKYTIIEFGIKRTIRKIKIFSNESYSSPVKRNFSDTFTISNVSKK